MIDASPSHVPPEEATLDGGLSGDRETPQDVLDECRELIAALSKDLVGKLMASMNPTNSGRVLTQVARIAVAQRKLLADLGDPYAPERSARAKRRRIGSDYAAASSPAYMDHETHGAKAMQEIIGVAMQAMAAHQLPGLVRAAAAAKTAGMDDVAADLARKVRVRLGAIPDQPPEPPSPTSVAAAARALESVGQRTLGESAVDIDGQQYPSYSSNVGEPDDYGDLLDALDADMEEQAGLGGMGGVGTAIPAPTLQTSSLPNLGEQGFEEA